MSGVPQPLTACWQSQGRLLSSSLSGRIPSRLSTLVRMSIVLKKQWVSLGKAARVPTIELRGQGILSLD